MDNLKLKDVAKWLNSTLIAADHAKEGVVTGVSTDTRTLVAGDLYVAIRGEQYDGHQFLKEAAAKGAVAALVDTPPFKIQASKGASSSSGLYAAGNHDTELASLPLIPVADTQFALGEIARRYRKLFHIPIAAITGSCGKTTVKEMLARILSVRGMNLANRGNLNTEIGVPLTLLRLDSSHETAVVEMGARKQGDIRYLMNIASPTVSVITNVGVAHLEIFGSEKGIAESKGEIYADLDPDGTAVINIESLYADYWKSLLKGQKVVTFGSNLPKRNRNSEFNRNLNNKENNMEPDISAHTIHETATGSNFILKTPLGEIQIELSAPGKHNIMNALTAAAAAYAMGITLPEIKKGLEVFTPVSGRLQMKLGKQGIRIIDDTYNANPQSVKAALAVLAAYSPNTIFVMGDMLELGNETEKMHQEMGEEAKRLKIARMFGVGPLTKLAVQAFGENGSHFSDKKSLIHSLSQVATKESTILIKGSRGMRMEEVVQSFTENLRENSSC